MGWDVQVDKDVSAHEKFEGRISTAATDLASRLGIEVEMAEILVREGMITTDVIATAEISDIAEILEIPADQAEAILAKARSALISLRVMIIH